MTTLIRPNVVREEMRRHREATKRPLHPGVTRAEAGYTPEQWELLSAGVCDGLATQTEAGERVAHRALLVLALVLIGLYVAGLLIGGIHG